MYNIRKANLSDLYLVADMRVEFMKSIKTIESTEEIYRYTVEYLRSHLETDDTIVYVAENNNKLS